MPMPSESEHPGPTHPVGVFGILNLTPDSFSDGGRFSSGMAMDETPSERASRVAATIGAALEMVAAGVDVLDLGGESTRPGSEAVSVEEELARIVPVLDAFAEVGVVPAGVRISVDTRRTPVAEAAADRGATIVNDTAALQDDPSLAAFVAARGLDVVLMHRLGTPATMQRNPRYDDLVTDVRAFFAERVEVALAAGIAPDRVTLDPGFGFGKTVANNYELMARLDELQPEGGAHPWLVGASRKSFLGRFAPAGHRPSDRLPGSLAFVAAAYAHRGQGVRWVRVHDVADTVTFLRTLAEIDRHATPVGRS